MSETKTKPGYKTTEFWLALAATLFSALFASGVITSGGKFEAVAGLIASTLTALGYTVTRAKSKAIEAPKA